MIAAKAAILRELSNPFSLESIAVEPPRADEVLVRIVGAGICHTDLKVAEGYRPAPLPGTGTTFRSVAMA